MSSNSDSALPNDFSGQVRLFPLPNLVMFPHGLQPLHIYEQRYRDLLEDALADDQMIAMALLQAGWEADYDGTPAIFPVICVGRIVSHARLEDGCYNIFLRGIKRASVIRELPGTGTYRKAEVAVLEDLYSAAAAAQRANVQEELMARFRQLVPDSKLSQQLLSEFQDKGVPLGVLTDIVAFTIQFEKLFKYKMLREWNVDVRAKWLLERLTALVEGDDDPGHAPFPPKFSEN